MAVGSSPTLARGRALASVPRPPAPTGPIQAWCRHPLGHIFEAGAASSRAEER